VYSDLFNAEKVAGVKVSYMYGVVSRSQTAISRPLFLCDIIGLAR